MALIGVLALGLNAGHYLRNFDLYSNPLGPGEEGEGYRYTNEVYSPGSLASNAIRNLAIHLGTPVQQLNLRIEKAIERLHERFGVDLNDPRTTWVGTQFRILETSQHEDYAGNPLHLALILALLPVLALRGLRQRTLLAYVTCQIAAFLLFCLGLRWQPWHSRLHLPWFVLWSPLVGYALSLIRPSWISNAVVVGVWLAGLPYVLANQTRPLLGEKSVLTSDRGGDVLQKLAGGLGFLSELRAMDTSSRLHAGRDRAWRRRKVTGAPCSLGRFPPGFCPPCQSGCRGTPGLPHCDALSAFAAEPTCCVAENGKPSTLRRLALAQTRRLSEQPETTARKPRANPQIP